MEERLNTFRGLNKDLISKILCYLPLQNVVKLKRVSREMNSAANVTISNYPCIDKLDYKSTYHKRKLLDLIENQCVNLQSVCFSNGHIEDVEFNEEDIEFLLRVVAKCKRIKALINVPSAFIDRLPIDLPLVEELRIKLSDQSSVKRIAEKCLNLKKIELCVTEYNKCDSIKPILEKCREIDSIKLHHIKLASDNYSLFYSGIKELCFYDSDLDDTECEMISRLKELKTLVVSGKNVTIEGLKYIGERLDNLDYLDIAETSLGPSICSFLSLSEVLPNLKRLVVNPSREKEFREAISDLCHPSVDSGTCQIF